MTWPSFAIGDKVLVCGLITRKYLIDSFSSTSSSFTIISYGDLLIQQTGIHFYESPRQRLTRLLETALIEKSSVIIFENFNEFLDEPGLWFHLKDFFFKRLEKTATIIVCVSNDNVINLIKDHFLTISKASDLFKERGISLIDFMAAEKESKILEMEVDRVIEKMIKEGRTCAQLMNTSSLIQGQDDNLSIVSGDLTLDKVYGIDKEIKNALLNGATFVKRSKGPRGILLHGPPGTGKTRLVLALSRTICKSTRFISVASSDLLRAEIGSSEQKLKEIFSLARSSQPAVIFFDEIDSIFPQNPPFHLLSLQHQLISELDAIEREQIISGQHCRVFLIAATNYLEKVSKRILGIERFHLEFEIKLPNNEERWEILVNELGNMDETFLKKLHKATRGKSPAEITKIIQNAYKNSWSRVKEPNNKESILMHLMEADFNLK